ncbi:hypothetical protein SDC9_209988 [bioreactor metagenome]|uniref:Uncharacterized protein n=1 Tax=bioreactor metagenome TaxID=1076179 RepID=A0A645JF58_9ZZZZ
MKADGILNTGTIDAAGKLIGKKLTTIDKSAQKAILEKYNEKAITSIVDVELKTAVETMAKLLK